LIVLSKAWCANNARVGEALWISFGICGKRKSKRKIKSKDGPECMKGEDSKNHEKRMCDGAMCKRRKTFINNGVWGHFVHFCNRFWGHFVHFCNGFWGHFVHFCNEIIPVGMYEYVIKEIVWRCVFDDACKWQMLFG